MGKRIRILLAGVCCALLAWAASAAGAPEARAEAAADDREIIECFMENFMLLTKVPRPSHHEEKISAFLAEWAEEQGLTPARDAANNLMIDVPATEGYEDLPMGILQGHMDMVVAVEDGKEFNPLEDPISAIRDDAAGTLTADGTSLGADDGAGVAIMMAAAQGKIKHGPIRLLITVDEEDGMEGAFAMDGAWLDGAAYLINIDTENSDEVLVSTAGGDSVRAEKKLRFAEPSGDTGLVVELSHLKGGHSGVEIDKGRLNGVVGLASFLLSLEQKGVPFELAALEGGTAGNAIPTRATATLVVRGEDRERIDQLAGAFARELGAKYEGIEEGILCAVTPVGTLPPVVSEEEKGNALRFATEVIDGVYTWSKDMDGLVESSSNLGIFRLNGDGISLATYTRSSVAEMEAEILNAQIRLAEACGYSVETVKMADSWPYDPDSKLLAKARDVYLSQNGKEIQVIAVHAGVECGTFKAMKPELDMICIGPDITDVHTVQETLYLNSVPRVWRLLEGLLTAAE